MKKLLLVTTSMLFSVAALAHSGHTPFEFTSVIEIIKHYLSSSYHIVAMLTVSMIFVVSALVISKRKQMFRMMLMLSGLVGSILGIGLLLS